MPGGRVVLSGSTWQQPLPAGRSAERASVISTVAARVTASRPGRTLVGVDGRTAAGKTTFGHELAEDLAAHGLTVLRASLDDFKKPWRDRHLYDRESGEGYYRNAFDYPALTRLLLDPFVGGASEVALCAIDPITQVDHSTLLTSVPASAVLVVDGVFAFRPEIDRWWDLRVWVKVDAVTSVGRGIERDRGQLGDTAASSLHRDRYGVAEAVYLAESDPVSRADVVIDNLDFDAPRILRLRRDVEPSTPGRP
jgi:uridine kinase